eukprot:TRINITY_DN10091_c0_g1_i1.p1 TRINITY_DN10091_c0_g1~~TRINITY_DN10091_c0_g1_i1.p1  ORF type:complete len:437 (+),score=64.08 TRINITY_DN10091_c0_g1_i1:88-1398(+)
MREIISIHVGQAGVRMGESCWELFCLEHGIQPDGTCHVSQDIPLNFFSESSCGRFVPRSLFVDLEPTICDEVKRGHYKDLFRPDSFVTGKEDASNVFTLGNYSIGKKIVDSTLDQIRKLANSCTGLQGFLIHHSIGGGTGSGFVSLLSEELAREYAKKFQMDFCILPSSQSSTSSIVEPYNAVLALHYLLDTMDATFFFDNESVFSMTERSLHVLKPSFSDANRLISEVISCATAGMRFPGPLRIDLTSMAINGLVPYPRMHFFLMSYSPNAHHRWFPSDPPTIDDLTKSAFEAENILVRCDPKRGKYMSCALIYRGDVLPKDISNTLTPLRKSKALRFVDWAPSGISCAISNRLPLVKVDEGWIELKRSLLAISNNTAIRDVFSLINYKFDLMYARRAFVHWFSGLESEAFQEAREDLAALELDYVECSAEETID